MTSGAGPPRTPRVGTQPDETRTTITARDIDTPVTSSGTSSDTSWDVVVVGAGPAGSSAARAAAAAGARTLLLDRATFPRYKTCGGGLIGVSQSLVEGLPDVPVLDDITSLTFSLRGRDLVTRRGAEVTMRMISREQLDHHLVGLAERDGVTFVPDTKVTRVEQVAADQVVVSTSAGPVLARSVVGADGTAGRCAAYVGPVYATVDLGLEVELDAGDQVERWRGRVHLDWGELPASYGWVFPKGDTLTVGVIADRGRPDETRAYLESFCRDTGVAGLTVRRSSGHLTKCRAPGSALARGSVLLAGDAAGLMEPWTREGISFALRSGRLAGARAAGIARAGAERQRVELETRRYRDEVDRTLGAEMRAGMLCRQAFARHPWVFHQLFARTGIGWTSFSRVAAGDTDLARALRHPSARLAVGLLARV